MATNPEQRTSNHGPRAVVSRSRAPAACPWFVNSGQRAVINGHLSVDTGPLPVARGVYHVYHQLPVCTTNKTAVLVHVKTLNTLRKLKVIHSVYRVYQHFSDFKTCVFFKNKTGLNSENTENGGTHGTQLILKEKWWYTLWYTPPRCWYTWYTS